jgi:metal-responsive CopG/Arc/MetJ family transcriptional regulator
MPAKPVQISIDTKLLQEIDADPETIRRGRSAFVRSAVELYLETRRRQKIEEGIARAYQGQAQAMLDEVSELLEGQTWPEQ